MSKIKIYEKFPWQNLSCDFVIGVDEVGRGCLAGPVYAAAACLKSSGCLEGIDDSKNLTPLKRKVLSDKISNEHWVAIGSASLEEIEQLNILHASLLAMKRAVLGLKLDLFKSHILVDGPYTIPGLEPKISQTAVVKGDQRATPIAAASIIAKVARDELLDKMSEDYPEYGFEKHKGYSTKLHKEAIAKYGPSSVHRRSFKGVKEFL